MGDCTAWLGQTLSGVHIDHTAQENGKQKKSQCQRKGKDGEWEVGGKGEGRTRHNKTLLKSF